MKNERGSSTLEMALVLPLFIFMMLVLMSLFFVVDAQNQITHALVQSTRSLSLDAFSNEKMNSATEEATVFWSNLGDMVFDLVRVGSLDPYYVTTTDWYDGSMLNAENVAKARFVGYLAGGDRNEAEEKLDALGVVDSLNGMDFKVAVEDGNVSVTVTYSLRFRLDVFGLGIIPMEQTITSKLWK